MPLPNVNLVFKTQGITAITRSEKGTVALLIRDTQALGGHQLTAVADIPAQLGAQNKAYVERAFLGYISPPRKVLLYVIGESGTLQEGLDYFATRTLDYLAGPPDLTEQEATAIAQWVKDQRLQNHSVKAVLPNTAADHEGIVNFSSLGMSAQGSTYTTAAYCSRMAGLLAGTPMTISCTYAPLRELAEVERLDKGALDAKIDAGELVLFHDGEKVKIGRGVNSLVTTVQGKGDAYKKIKIVEAMDMIQNDIRMTAQDSYIGKYANSYDNKCLLIMAIKGYFEELERAGILESGHSVVEIDLSAQEGYLRSNGIDTAEMSEQDIKEASTGSKVFLAATIRILDAIEDIDLIINI